MAEKQAGDYEVEYAKSGRANCKGCRSPIAQGSVRIATLVRSPFFDGLQPNWHHLRCILKKAEGRRINGVENIHGFSNLRWEDQQMLKEKIGASGGSANGEPIKANPHGLKVERAKSGRSTCRACDEKIAQNSLRLALLVESEQAVTLTVPAWHHPKCFVEFHADKVSSVDDFDGSRKLGKRDKATLTALLKGETPPPSDEEESEEESEEEEEKEMKSAKPEVGPSSSCIKEEEDQLSAPSSRRTRSGKRAAAQPPEDEKPGKRKKVKKEEHTVETTPDIKPNKRAKVENEPENESKKEPVSENEAKLRDQTNALWAARDILSSSGGRVIKSEYLHILHSNGINVGDYLNPDDVINILADAMTFGVTEMCPECGKSRLVPTESCYRCPTHLEWGRCGYTTTEPRFRKFSLPRDNDVEWKGIYKYTPRERIFLKKEGPKPPLVKPLTAAQLKKEIAEKKSAKEATVIETEKPFEGRTIACAGKLGQTHAAFQKLIGKGGGIFSKSVDQDVWFLIATQAEVAKDSAKIQQAKASAVDIVDPSYITDCMDQQTRFDFRDAKYLVLGNSAPEKPAAPPDRRRKGEFDEETMERAPKTAKLIVKGGAVVDPESELEDSHHVLNEGGKLWSVVLSKTDIERNLNTYYKLQILEIDNDKHGRPYYLFRSWGRVGTTRGGLKLESHPKHVCKSEFERLYEEKSGNEFGSKNPVKHPGLMYPLEVAHDLHAGDNPEDDEFESMNRPVKPGAKSKLEKEVQDLIKLVFDVKVMKQALKEMEIDLRKMPLGKISARLIGEAYKVLADALDLVMSGTNNPGRKTKIVSLSNHFFTIIPHDFGLDSAPLLDNEKLIRNKLETLDTLKDIEIATSLLKKDKEKEEREEEEDPVDIEYRKLNTAIEVLDSESDEYKLIEKCTSTTHAPTHTNYTLHIQNVFKIERSGERDAYRGAKIPNKRLLWHGSRLSNFAGILSQGLRIAPPEAPVTGYMFGKGIYFADMVSKSANYCNANTSQTTALLLLSEVALGVEYPLAHSEFVEKLPRGKHSTKGCGKTGPTTFVPLPNVPPDHDPITVPIGPPVEQPVPDKKRKTELLYNEYIVYDPRQVVLRYLVQVEFEFGGRR
ncbi:hypothetical protein PhCBS80983_g04451 [Powellomyces hirtus]|uniref:Poly [ADP-ribose] polymerase n=1 Tax=Powellomyces hirtus TaxID=109895 RepID=A0A507DYZ5_9FUNG|nr:hypothetical protein PhCBS80983_g04451 [Powellomyces hirtus]